MRKRVHHHFFLRVRQPAVQEFDLMADEFAVRQFIERRCHAGGGDAFGFFDQRRHEVRLPTFS